jgi:ferredoxin-NADP reductase/MOSC domain-containing protein YiiM
VATLLSVNVGMPHDVGWRGRTVRTGSWKAPVDGPVLARRLNLDGDGQGDLNGHGGEQRAVMVYQAESYAHWSRELGRADLEWGIFGENFTVDGLADAEVCIGDRYAIGDAEFEVTQPRTTCYRVGMRLGEPAMAALLVAHRRPGFYFRVLREGYVRAGDEIVRTARGPERISVAATDALLYLPGADVATMRRALNIDALSPGWRGSFRDLVDATDHPAPPAVPPPAWAGFRAMRVERVVRETDLVTSVHIGPVGGGPVPAALPGQYLSIRFPGAGDPAPVRSYSLSAPAGGGYRISVKREPHGAVSGYVAGLAVGAEVDVAAPRGEFVLRDGPEPVVLLSAGIGVTPVLAMLHALVTRGDTRPVWWLHTTASPATYALATEAADLVAALPAGRSRVFYTGDGGRRLDRETLAGLDLPVEASAYVCGPAGFMDAMTAALADLGLAPSRIHTELFASLSAINPGVLPADRPSPHPPAEPGTGPPVTFARAGVTAGYGPAWPSLLELAEACDVPTRWSCRTGVCHTCVTPVLSGAVAYTLDPLVPPEPGTALICCSRPDGPVVLDL